MRRQLSTFQKFSTNSVQEPGLYEPVQLRRFSNYKLSWHTNLFPNKNSKLKFCFWPSELECKDDKSEKFATEKPVKYWCSKEKIATNKTDGSERIMIADLLTSAWQYMVVLSGSRRSPKLIKHDCMTPTAWATWWHYIFNSWCRWPLPTTLNWVIEGRT